MEQLTKEQAIAFFESEAWKNMTHRERAVFQMEQDKLCMPFDVFHESMEKALGRPVWTHEFGLNNEGLKAELNGDIPPPSLEEIFDMIPEEKRLILVIDSKANLDTDCGGEPNDG